MKSQKYNGQPDIINWLNRQLLIHPPIIDIDRQFQNGYLFQEVLMKCGQQLKSRVLLQNKYDEPVIRKNFQQIEQTIIKLVGIQPKVEKGQSLIQEYLRIIKNNTPNKPIKNVSNIDQVEKKIVQKGELLQTLTKTLQITDRHQINSLINNYDQEYVKSLPPKIQKIESQLGKFKDEKLMHEIKAVKLKQLEEQKELQWLESLRDQELQKIRSNHQFIKDQDQRIYEFWRGTEKVKHDRIDREVALNKKMTEGMKKRIEAEGIAENQEVKENLQYFVASCIRQGVELTHDSEKKSHVQEKAYFSAVATMMKIRERTRKNEEARQGREKRRNKMLVDQQVQQAEVETKKRGEELIQMFLQESKRSNGRGHKILIDRLREQGLTYERIIEVRRRVQEQEDQFSELQKHARLREQELLPQRRSLWRESQLTYMQINLDTKISKRNKHRQFINPIIQSILDLTDLCFQQQSNQQTIDTPLWRQIMDRWVESYIEDNNSLGNNPKEIQTITLKSISIDQGQSQEFYQYYCGGGDWRPTHYYMDEDKALYNRPFNNQDLGDLVFGVVDRLYPSTPLKPIPNDLPTYLPLRLSVVGGRSSGRRTVCALLSQRLGLEVWSPESLIKEALFQAAPVVEDLGQKKKKDTKKVVEEVVVKENPDLKALGLEMLEYREKMERIPDSIIIKAIILKIKQTFPPKTVQEVEQDIKDAAVKDQERKQAFIDLNSKQQEDSKLKKPSLVKKQAKLPLQTLLSEVSEAPNNQDQIQKFISSKNHSYTRGWVLVGFPETIYQARLLEEALTGYIPAAERINSDAEIIKKGIQELVSPALLQESNTPALSGIDHIICLNAPLEERFRRAQLKRLDPLTDTIYSLEDCPPDVKSRLIVINDPLDSHENLTREAQEFDHQMSEIQEWCAQFGQQFQSVDASPKSLDVATAVNAIIELVLSSKKEFLQVEVDQPLELIEEDTSIQQHLSSLIDPQYCEILLRQWREIQNAYSKEISQHLKKMSSHRRRVIKELSEAQSSFLELFERPSEDGGNSYLMNGISGGRQLKRFEESLRKFMQDKQNVARQKNAQDELLDRLQSVKEQIWDSLEEKKNSSVAYLQQLKSSGWLEGELTQFMSMLMMVLQTEANLLSELCELVYNAKASLRGVFVQELGEHYILDPFEFSQDIPLMNPDDIDLYPQIDQMCQFFIDSLDRIQQTFLESKEKLVHKHESHPANMETLNSVDEFIKQLLSSQKVISIYRAHSLRTQAISRMKEIRTLQQIVCNRIDDWIIFGIKRENSYAYEWAQHLQTAISTHAFPSFLKQLPHKISVSFHPVLHNTLLARPLLPFYETNATQRFLLHHWYAWSQELRVLVDDRGVIPIFTFAEQLQRRLNISVGLPNWMLSLDATEFSVRLQSKIHVNGQSGPISQSVSPNLGFYKYINMVSQSGGMQMGISLGPLLLSTLLLESNLPTNEDVQSYIKDLREARGEDMEEFCEVPAWFDESEAAIVADKNIHLDRVYLVKRFIFQTFCSVDQRLNLNYFQNVLEVFQSNDGTLTFKDFLLK